MKAIDKHYLHYSKDKSQNHIGISQKHYMSILQWPLVFVQTEKSKPYIQTQVEISYLVDASDYEFGIPLSATLNFSLHHSRLEGRNLYMSILGRKCLMVCLKTGNWNTLAKDGTLKTTLKVKSSLHCTKMFGTRRKVGASYLNPKCGSSGMLFDGDLFAEGRM